jgi:hypothetical protein
MLRMTKNERADAEQQLARVLRGGVNTASATVVAATIARLKEDDLYEELAETAWEGAARAALDANGCVTVLNESDRDCLIQALVDGFAQALRQPIDEE